MKISEAIRIGSEVSQRCELHLTTRDDEGNLFACALGAAHIGSGGDPNMQSRDIYRRIEEQWPELLSVRVPDEDEGKNINLETAIWCKNDNKHWPREQTADWLEGLGY